MPEKIQWTSLTTSEKSLYVKIEEVQVVGPAFLLRVGNDNRQDIYARRIWMRGSQDFIILDTSENMERLGF